MGYCCQGSEEYVTFKDLKKKCTEMQKMIDEKFKDLDDTSIKLLKTQIAAINGTISGILQEQETQNSRISDLEDKAANMEITVDEIKNMYDRGSIDG